MWCARDAVWQDSKLVGWVLAHVQNVGCTCEHDSTQAAHPACRLQQQLPLPLAWQSLAPPPVASRSNHQIWLFKTHPEMVVKAPHDQHHGSVPSKPYQKGTPNYLLTETPKL